MSDFQFAVRETHSGTWAVYLPHQCQQWDIAGEDGGEYGEGEPHERAVELVEAFVAEAQAALAALRERTEVRP